MYSITQVTVVPVGTPAIFRVTSLDDISAVYVMVKPVVDGADISASVDIVTIEPLCITFIGCNM